MQARTALAKSGCLGRAAVLLEWRRSLARRRTRGPKQGPRGVARVGQGKGYRVMSTVSVPITKSPARCGGEACVGDSRITVWGLVESRVLGMSDETILASIPELTPAGLQAAFEYAAAHKEEIDRAIAENGEGEEGPVE